MKNFLLGYLSSSSAENESLLPMPTMSGAGPPSPCSSPPVPASFASPLFCHRFFALKRNLSLPLPRGHILCPFQSDTTKCSPPNSIRMETYHLCMLSLSFYNGHHFLQFFTTVLATMPCRVRPEIFVSVTCSDFCDKKFYSIEPSPT